MIIATYFNETKNIRSEFQQIGADAYSVKRYRPGYKEDTWELSGEWYFDSYKKAEAFYNNNK